MKPKILLVDDEPDIVEFLQYNLEQEGFAVITSFDGEDALQKIHSRPNLIILDIMMPKMNGYQVCEKIRSIPEYADIPIIFLTAKSGEIDEVKGLEIGADDYIRKPISPKKLLARVKSNLRKVDITPDLRHAKIILGPLEIDPGKYIVIFRGQELVFPKKEFEILSFLARNPEKVISRDQMLREVWGSEVYVVERTIDVHIRKIREKLGEYSSVIETVKGVGYRLKIPA